MAKAVLGKGLGALIKTHVVSPTPAVENGERVQLMMLGQIVASPLQPRTHFSDETINELVENLIQLTGTPLQPEYRPQEHMFVTHRVGSTEKAVGMLDFRATVPLVEGLQSVVEWRRTDRQREAGVRA